MDKKTIDTILEHHNPEMLRFNMCNKEILFLNKLKSMLYVSDNFYKKTVDYMFDRYEHYRTNKKIMKGFNSEKEIKQFSRFNALQDAVLELYEEHYSIEDMRYKLGIK